MAATPQCESARQAISLSIDGELSEFELFLLKAHVERCSSCRAFKAELTSVTAAIRLALPEPLPHPVGLPHRRRMPYRTNVLSVAAAAAVAVIAVGLGTVLPSSQPGSPARRAQPPVVVKNLQSDDVLVRAVQRSVPPPPQIGVPISIDGNTF